MLTTSAVFVQWVPMLCLLGRMLFQSGFRFVYPWGDMQPHQQEGCIEAFTERPEIKVMVSAHPNDNPLTRMLSPANLCTL